MTYKQALKLAVKALEKSRQVHAFDANLYKAGVVTVRTTLAKKEYDKFNSAISLLLGE